MYDLLFYLIVALGINILMFIPAFIFRTDKLTDLSYALSFIAVIIISLLISTVSALKIVLAFAIIIWALRLGIFLFIRIRKMKFDKRFDGMRESFFRFLKFWLLQGLAVWAILISSLLFMSSSAARVCWLGLLIWLSGLIIESVSDIQKYRFNQDKKNKGMFISSGLWGYSRHPNYFGEMLCWIGVYIFVFPSLASWDKLIALASPLFIVILLLFVSGIPLLERSADKKWGKLKAYKDYKRKTSILILWIPRR